MAAEHHHEIEGIAPELHPTQPLGPDCAILFFQPDGSMLDHGMPMGVLIRLGDVAMNSDSPLYPMRCAQDALFGQDATAV